MRNILLTTTALATLFVGVASAHTDHKAEKTIVDSEGLSVTFGGSIEAQAGTRSQKNAYTAQGTGTGAYNQGMTPGNKNVAFDTVAAVHANVQNKTAEGTTYGAQVGILATTRSQLPAGQSALDRTFMFVENDDMGRVELGTNNGSASTMRTGAESIARATGGIDGQWGNYVVLNNNTGFASSNFITAPTTILTNFSQQNSGSLSNLTFPGDEKSRKITYYTPTYNGFQAGLTYIPDVRNTGQDYISNNQQLISPPNQYNSPAAKNAISGGLSWKGEFEKSQSLQVSVVGETSQTALNSYDKAAGNKFYNNQSVVVGAKYAYEDFSVAASYGNKGKSGLTKNALPAGSVALKGGSFWTLGAAYVQGPVGASLTYMNSTLNKNNLSFL